MTGLALVRDEGVAPRLFDNLQIAQHFVAVGQSIAKIEQYISIAGREKNCYYIRLAYLESLKLKERLKLIDNWDKIVR